MPTDPDALHARVEQWQENFKNWGESQTIAEVVADRLIRDLAAEVTRLRENEGLLFRPLSNALTGGNASQWDEIIHAAETRQAKVSALQAQLHAAEATIATVEKQLGVCDRMLQDEIEDNRVRHPHE